MTQGKDRPIGVFDSGMGGLSVLRALERRLPGENYIYFGDTARVPYGNRDPGEVSRFTVEIGLWFQAQGCKMLLIACNTATVLGMAALAAATTLPVYGMVEAATAAALAANLWPLGLIATKGTVESGAYQAAIAAQAPGQPFYAQACPDFIPLVEQGILEGPQVAQTAENYLRPLKEKGIRGLVLGCTHFPFLAGPIAAYLGEDVRLLDPAPHLARMVEEYLQGQDLLNDGDGDAGATGARDFYCSGSPEAFRAQGGRLLGRPLQEVGRQVF
jgi:glutamate racemase